MADYYPATLVIGARKEDLPERVLRVITEGFEFDNGIMADGDFDNAVTAEGETPTRCYVELYEARYGVEAFRDVDLDLDPDDENVPSTTDLLALLQEEGLAYEATDEGKYEFSGEREWWKPGMDAPRSGTANQDGAVLPAHTYFQLVAKWEHAPVGILTDIADIFAGPWD